jgi:hypothetical protein
MARQVVVLQRKTEESNCLADAAISGSLQSELKVGFTDSLGNLEDCVVVTISVGAHNQSCSEVGISQH